MDAQNFLEQAAQNNLGEFLVGLCQVLADTNQSEVARAAAGLQVFTSYILRSFQFCPA